MGKELAKIYPGALTPTIEEMNLMDADSISGYISEHKPEIIIHLAALTDIRECERSKELAYKVNVLGTRDLIKTCLVFNKNCYFIYLSTACVFYGDRGNYSEDDIPHPKNFYSLTKFLGEIMVQCYGEEADWLIIRTNFVSREKWPYPKAFTDRQGTYLFADELVQAMKKVIDQRLTRIVHVCGKEKLSIYELAKITTPDIQPMTLAEYSGPPLTQDMTLISKKIPPFKLRRKI